MRHLRPYVAYGDDRTPASTPVPSRLLQLPVRLIRVNVGGEGSPSTVTINTNRGAPTVTSRPETLIVDASVKPFINLLWGGTVILLAGFALAIVKRFRE